MEIDFRLDIGQAFIRDPIAIAPTTIHIVSQSKRHDSTVARQHRLTPLAANIQARGNIYN